jgi:hypothetical protein
MITSLRPQVSDPDGRPAAPPAGGSVLRLCLRLLPYAARRWPGLLAVGTTLGLKTAVDVLRPWPMALLVDQVLQGQPLPAALDQALNLLGAQPTRETLLLWSIVATVVLFLAWSTRP